MSTINEDEKNYHAYDDSDDNSFARIAYFIHNVSYTMNQPKINSLIAQTLIKGGIGVLPTDTIYGIVGSALNKKTVETIYRLRHRNPQKPMIILIGSVADVRLFGIHITRDIKRILNKVWPGAVSVVLPMGGSAQTIKKFTYLHRGTKTMAFRLPRLPWLRTLLEETGPLVAPSANVEGHPPARNIKEAKKYFSDTIQFYVDAGRRVSQPSTLLKIEHGVVTVLRKGSARARLL